MTTPLHEIRCTPQSGKALGLADAQALLARLDDWTLVGDAIEKSYSFADFHHTMAFVNAVAWIAHVEDHHPVLAVGYNRCTVRYSTHSVNGLSINDYACAAKVDRLLAGGAQP